MPSFAWYRPDAVVEFVLNVWEVEWVFVSGVNAERPEEVVIDWWDGNALDVVALCATLYRILSGGERKSP